MNAADAGARLRTGAGTHTLSIGDHSVTLMISGSRVELQRFALAVAAETGLKIRVDGHIDGSTVVQTLSQDHKALIGETQRLAGRLRRLEEEPSTQDIAERIQAKVIEINGGRSPIGRGGLSVSYLTGAGGCKKAHSGGWCASVYIAKYGQPVSAHGGTAEAAFRALAEVIGP